jgi:hypothetical protein
VDADFNLVNNFAWLDSKFREWIGV